MGKVTQVPNVLALMIQHEQTVGEIYRVFARRIPADAEFWLAIARDENVHADWIRDFAAQVQESGAAFNEVRFNLHALQTSLDYLKVLKTHAEGITTPARALAMALQIEHSMMEKELFRIANGDAEALKNVLERLADGTTAHIRRLEEYQKQQKTRATPPDA
ncbi:MAG: hypothetical protein N3D11_17200 [Candidatus Sumerlaeia bacterium]|nr:hypothetical protein [Candidatus Sumerlaeia bacterium]